MSEPISETEYDRMLAMTRVKQILETVPVPAGEAFPYTSAEQIAEHLVNQMDPVVARLQKGEVHLTLSLRKPVTMAAFQVVDGSHPGADPGN